MGGRRRDRDARDPSGRSRDPDRDRLDRPRCVSARLRQRQPDDDAAGRLGRAGVHAGPRRSSLRHPPGPDSGLHRTQGRHVGQHPGDSRHRRQDRRSADRTVRVAGGSARARGRPFACAPKERHRVRGPGAAVEAARDDAPRSRAQLRPGRARAPPARPLGAPGDVQALRVPQSARARRHPRRGGPCAADARAGHRGRVA